MPHFVLVFNRRTGEIVQQADFADDQRERALQQRFELEDEYRQNPDVEVVSLSAESFDALQTTHSRYFAEALHRRAASATG